ncbi:MAG: endonuclease/exonuclease/phosphatase family protein [Woeseiaceae bacterium]|nr:endonuclease/exonuclease/phosphatase family protein [Woeseiaceae bacterium]
MRPLTQCSFASIEPLLRTPKGTSISQYGLAGDDRSLVVVNVHAVNFSLGLGVFERQFERIGEVLAAHDGPLILSGDFNTWRPGRQRIIDGLAAALGLSPVTYAEDFRPRVFGQAIDHIYVRGLTTITSSTSDVTTSDHSPMTVTLGTTPPVEAD